MASILFKLNVIFIVIYIGIILNSSLGKGGSNDENERGNELKGKKDENVSRITETEYKRRAKEAQQKSAKQKSDREIQTVSALIKRVNEVKGKKDENDENAKASENENAKASETENVTSIVATIDKIAENVTSIEATIDFIAENASSIKATIVYIASIVYIENIDETVNENSGQSDSQGFETGERGGK